MEETYKNHTIKISQDETPDNPRNWDNLGTLCLFHNRYTVANETDLDSDDYLGWADLKAAIVKEYDPAVILPVYAYDHSCFVLSTQIERTWWHAAWDSGQLGFAFISRKDALRDFGWKVITKKRLAVLTDLLKAELHIYSQWINGDVYEYVIRDEDGDVISSCGGFYNEDDALAAAKDELGE
jgi:hypothetical protein